MSRSRLVQLKEMEIQGRNALAFYNGKAPMTVLTTVARSWRIVRHKRIQAERARGIGVSKVEHENE